MEHTVLEHQEAIAKLRKFAEDVNICMFTTLTEACELNTRPMATARVDDDATIWFFSNEFSGKTTEVQHSDDQTVYLLYAHPGKNIYVNLIGSCEIVRDKAKMKELYSPVIKAWFPDGLNDPDMCLLKVSAKEAYYWNSTSNKMVAFLHMLKAIATGEQYDEGETGKLEFE
ncbi:pyridoxamine 5'-phosphate oxidase family protein [Deminuibacter soli]|uniref:Pyridoxamine 5'-phosphate oxidase n=1 Tax=Deminuibacter soli TaxID=2291815 RepID=A0A3E1NL08_9BACT|nr:pyridoxamine 5'-phosphate oxidase family protein [Deminuibacter soli]RFM28620.1 pyridoxamine 5'-phosphate oxidase [Deminuibacter soli]